MNLLTIIALGLAVVVIVAIAKTITIVPQREAYIVERLGKYSSTLEAGLHILIPFLDRIAYRHTLKEEAMDVPQQTCITKDNIQVVVDGVLYMQVIDPQAASYGIANYRYAATQLAQTTLRSVIGRIDLDKTFEEREKINVAVVEALDEAAATWGIKVMRYEIADIQLPPSIADALEKQMRAERERRAVVAASEGEKQAKINISEGAKQEAINLSEAEKIRQVNVAEGRAEEIKLIAEATAEGLKTVAAAIAAEGGKDAVALRIAEQYVKEFGNLAKQSNTMIIPADVANIGGTVATLASVLGEAKRG